MWSQLKAALPIRLGGVGLRRACDYAAAIFLESVHSCSSLILDVSGQEVPALYASGLPDVSSFDTFDFPVSQKALSRAIDQSNFDQLNSNNFDSNSENLIPTVLIGEVLILCPRETHLMWSIKKKKAGIISL